MPEPPFWVEAPPSSSARGVRRGLAMSGWLPPWSGADRAVSAPVRSRGGQRLDYLHRLTLGSRHPSGTAAEAGPGALRIPVPTGALRSTGHSGPVAVVRSSGRAPRLGSRGREATRTPLGSVLLSNPGPRLPGQATVQNPGRGERICGPPRLIRQVTCRSPYPARGIQLASTFGWDAGCSGSVEV